MKIFGVDFGVKYFFAEIDGIPYTIAFRCSFFKGVTQPKIYISDGKNHEIKMDYGRLYPGLLRRMREAWYLLKNHLCKEK